MYNALPLWRGSLLPLGCEAVLKPVTAFCRIESVSRIATASRSSGSKLPRHNRNAEVGEYA
jgi:hypothetical protein